MIEKTIKLQERLDKYARKFCEYLTWEKDFEFRWVADEIGWVFYVNDMFFNIQDAMLYSLFEPDDIYSIYHDYLECEWQIDWVNVNLKNFIKNVWLKKDEEIVEKTLTPDDKIKNCFCSFKDSLKLPPVKFDRKFILCLSTWELLYSEREWQFKQSSDQSCFIDQTEHYMRIGWEEWKDFIYLN